MFSCCEVDLSELRDTGFSFPLLWELSFEEVVGEDLEAVLTFPFLWVLSFLRTVLMAPEAIFVFLFPGCSPCYEDGVVAL